MLLELIELLHFREVIFFDESVLGRLGAASRFFRDTLSNPAIWRRLALRRDPTAVQRALGWIFPAGEPDWRAICRACHPRAAVGAWAAAQGEGLWEELHDGDRADGGDEVVEEEEQTRAASRPWWALGRRAGNQRDAAAVVPIGRGELWAGQSPHLFWLGSGSLLAIAGGYFSDNLGGASVLPLHDVSLLELPPEPGTGLRVTTLIPGHVGMPTREGHQGHAHLSGAASDLDAEGRRVLFFGGGSPHGGLSDATSALVLSGGHEDAAAEWQGLEARWEHVEVAEVEKPSARQGVRGVVFDRRFVIFGGRGLGGQCFNDVWALSLDTGSGSRPMWHCIECEGQAPSPRVWYAACHATHGQWFVIGGSEWQFTRPGHSHDYCTLYVLDLRAMRWSTLASQGSLHSPTQRSETIDETVEEETADAGPPWVVAPSLVALGGRELLFLGGCMPHKMGERRLDRQNMRNWQQWYRRLDRPFLFDRATGEWSPRLARLTATTTGAGSPEERISANYLRSHFAAVYVPRRRSVLVLGGSRYFTGEYFHDLLELRSPSTQVQGAAPLAGALRARFPRHMVAGHRTFDGTRPLFTRGLRGRLRAMVRDGHLNIQQYRALMQTL